MTGEHTTHSSDVLAVTTCPSCAAEWQVLWATQADPLAVLDPEPAEHPERVIAWGCAAAVAWAVAGAIAAIVWRLVTR